MLKVDTANYFAEKVRAQNSFGNTAIIDIRLVRLAKLKLTIRYLCARAKLESLLQVLRQTTYLGYARFVLLRLSELLNRTARAVHPLPLANAYPV